jgi:hypothetical protein
LVADPARGLPDRGLLDVPSDHTHDTDLSLGSQISARATRRGSRFHGSRISSEIYGTPISRISFKIYGTRISRISFKIYGTRISRISFGIYGTRISRISFGIYGTPISRISFKIYGTRISRISFKIYGTRISRISFGIYGTRIPGSLSRSTGRGSRGFPLSVRNQSDVLEVSALLV